MSRAQQENEPVTEKNENQEIQRQGVGTGEDVSLREGWIRIKDKLPEPRTLVLVYAPNCHVIGSILIGQYFEEENHYAASWTVYDFGPSNLGEKVTHWMPLPEEP